MLAYDYPLLGLFWTMLVFFIWIAWLMLVFRVFADIFRSKDLRGIAKAGWTIFVLVIPFIGVLVYLLVRGDGMTERDIERARAAEADFRDYVRQSAGGGGVAEEISKLAALRDSGALTDAEFEAQKARLLT